MDTLNGLLELHLVPQQYDILRTGPHGDQISQGNLAGFIHKEVVQFPVELRVRKQPGRTGHQVRTRVDD